MPGFEKDIIRFYITMQYMQLVQRSKCIDQLLKNPQSLLFREMPPGPDKLLQRAPLAVLINEINIPICLDHLHKLDNINIILQ